MENNMQNIFLFTSGFVVGYLLKGNLCLSCDSCKTKDIIINELKIPPYIRGDFMNKKKFRHHF